MKWRRVVPTVSFGCFAKQRRYLPYTHYATYYYYVLVTNHYLLPAYPPTHYLPTHLLLTTYRVHLLLATYHILPELLAERHSACTSSASRLSEGVRHLTPRLRALPP